MNRRGFLHSILAASVAPYVIASSGVLMPVRKVLTRNEYLDVIVRYSMPLSGLGISGNSLLIGNEESLNVCQMNARVPMHGMARGDSILVGRLPLHARVETIQSSQGIVSINGENVLIRFDA